MYAIESFVRSEFIAMTVPACRKIICAMVTVLLVQKRRISPYQMGF